jgi:heat shock protein HslJ
VKPWPAIIVLALAGCAQTAPLPPSPPFTGTYWRAAEIEGVPYRAPAGAREVHLRFASDRVSGFTGCNNLAGGYERDGERLHFKPLATTRMACLPAGDLETRFLSALQATASHRVSGGTLELLDAGGKTRLRLEARDSK